MSDKITPYNYVIPWFIHQKRHPDLYRMSGIRSIIPGGEMRKFLGLMSIFMIISGCEWFKETTISGTVTNGGEPVSGAIVLLLESDTLLAGLSLTNGSITNSNGRYEIVRVEPGNYYISAIKDENENLQYDKEIDMFGWYGERDTLIGLTIPQQVAVAKGNNLTGMDIDTLYIVP